MKVFAVMDHVCEADILVAVFSDKPLAKAWIKAHEHDPYTNGSSADRYEALAIEEVELDPK